MRFDAITSQAQREAQARYDAENTKQITLKLNLKTDSDILAHLEEKKAAKGGKQGYIKELIRNDMKKQGK